MARPSESSSLRGVSSDAVEVVGCLHQADPGDLDEVVERLGGVPVAPRQLVGQR
jgi:hypothetical protein